MMKFMDIVSNESAVICPKGPENHTCFRHIPLENLLEFEWTKCIAELQDKAPTLLRLFSAIVKHNDHRNTSKHGEPHHPGICMAMAILMKERNREMCGIQSLVSLLLFKGQAHKKASACMCVCVNVVS